MKRLQKFYSLLLLLAMFGLSALHAQSYDKLWKQVEQAQKKSLPQTVVKLTEEIYRKGEQEQNVPQMLKAYICRESYQQRLTPDSLYSGLKNMERWVAAEKNPVNKAILHSLLANEYADLMKNNRYALLKRMLLDANDVPENIREWSIPQFVSKIDEHIHASLRDLGRLLETSTEKYIPFTVLKDGSRFYQHDMYHLLASRAISTYNGLNGFNMDTLFYSHVDSIYKDLIKTYRQRKGAENAVLICSLNYCEWKKNISVQSKPYPVFERKSDQQSKKYLQRLDDLIEEFGAHEVCAEVYIKKASWLSGSMNKPDITEALKVCDEGLKRYSSYNRINELKNIREAILQPQLNVNTLGSGYPGDSVNLNVQFRNLGGFTLNIYATNLAEVPQADRNSPKSAYKKYARKLSSMHFDLHLFPDKGKLLEDIPYLSTDTVFKLKIPNETGVYILQLVPDAVTDQPVEQFLVSTRFKVLVLDLGDGRMEVTTLDASSGHPIAYAKVSFYSYYNSLDRKLLVEAMTDSGGKAIIPWQSGTQTYVVRKGNDTAMMPQYVYMRRASNHGEDASMVRVALLTDRSLYRPGQTVHVKGIAYKSKADSAQVFEGADFELQLLDANRKELATQKVRTNDFGSFATEFVLPDVCLNGMFTLQIKESQSDVSFRVEEYKRPSFSITFTPASEPYKLGDKVVLKGNVKAFNGMTVQNVPLIYTVNRSDPNLNYWNNTQKPLLTDTLRLNANGDFYISLTLDAPDENINEHVYTYHVEATVTNEVGETQTAFYNLLAGSKAYLFDVRLPQYICKEDSLFFTLGVNNRQNIPQLMKGTYRLYSLEKTDLLRGENGVVLVKTKKKMNTETTPEKPVIEGTFTANQRENFSAWRQLPSGTYRLELSVRDSLGREETNQGEGESRFTLFSKNDTRLANFTDIFYYKENEEFDAEHPGAFLLGTSFKNAYVLMDVFYKQKRIESRVLQLNDAIIRVEYPYKEIYGDGISILFSFVKGGEMYTQQVYLRKRQPEPILQHKWEVFRDRLLPGQQEEWKLVIKSPKGTPAEAEILATMYDASLDKIYSHKQLLRVLYPDRLHGVFRDASRYNFNFFSINFPLKSWKVPEWSFDLFWSPEDELLDIPFFESNTFLNEAVVIAYGTRSTTGLKTKGMQSNAVGADDKRLVEPEYTSSLAKENNVLFSDFELEDVADNEETLRPVANLRTNFSETAFFYPQLRTNEQGEVAFSFIMPQSLTRWNFRGYSHTKNMMTGMFDETIVTAKEFMLTPNLPRFVRIGDKTQIAASVANLTDKAIKGTVTFILFDPMSEKVISTQRQKFLAEAGKTDAVNFRFEVTDRYSALGVRMIADGGAFSDGEQHLLPVLSNKEFITEALAIPIRGEETRTIPLDSLFNHNAYTATDRRLTVEFTGNPAWYAIQSLPVLSLPSTDNAISWATAYYANTLAGFIVKSQPRIKAIFDRWKLTDTTKESFLGKLEKNQEVKNILINESPWLLEAITEAEQQARIATLFDLNQQNNRNLSALNKLKELQNEDGSWSWYKGMYGSRYITVYITELLVRLSLITDEKLPSEMLEMKQKAFNYLNNDILTEYHNLREVEKKGTKYPTLSEASMDYLYLIALSGEKVPLESQTAYSYLLSKVGNHLENSTIVRKAQSAIILQAAERIAEVDKFIASIKEHLVHTDSQGAYFDFHATPYNWGMLSVPAHVQVMEALLRVGGNDTLVEEMKLWLLKQKQATSWNSPVATADAVYVLLSQGSDLLNNQGDVRITLGDKILETLSPTKTSIPGLGYIKEVLTQEDTSLKSKSVTVEKRDAGIAWGAVYAQYLSPISDVKQQGGELNVTKKIYIERAFSDGRKSLEEITNKTRLAVGDKVVSRLTLTLDRAMDFIQLKDGRSACFEPIGVLSGYRWSNGFSYYIEIKDAATNFFFDHLGKGVYVLEHSYRITRGGTYETGLATMQCAYAPEYVSHSVGGTIVVIN